MSKGRIALRLAGYAGFCALCFAVSLWLTFPEEVLRDRVFGALDDLVGGAATIKAEGFALSGLSTVRLDEVNIFVAGEAGAKPRRYTLERLEIELHLLATLAKLLSGPDKKAVLGPLGGLDITLRHGDGRASATLTEAGTALGLAGRLAGLQLGRTPLRDALPLPLQGQATGTIELDSPGGQWARDGTGTVALTIANLVLGPGQFTTPLGPLTVPELRCGTLELSLGIEKGRATIKSWKQAGPDLAESTLAGGITLRPRLGESTLDLRLTFRPSDAFLDGQGTLRSLLELSGMQKDPQGAYKLALAGRLDQPQPRGLSAAFKLQ